MHDLVYCLRHTLTFLFFPRAMSGGFLLCSGISARQKLRFPAAVVGRLRGSLVGVWWEGPWKIRGLDFKYGKMARTGSVT